MQTLAELPYNLWHSVEISYLARYETQCPTDFGRQFISKWQTRRLREIRTKCEFPKARILCGHI